MTTKDMNAERIYELFVGDHVALAEFVTNGELSTSAVEEQIAYCEGEGWFEEGGVTPDDVRQAIAVLVAADLEYRKEMEME